MPGMLKALAVPLAMWTVGCSAAECPDGKHMYYGAQEFLNKCYVFCLPEGKCIKHADRGHWHRLGIRGPGGCIDRGYTEPSEFGEISRIHKNHIDTLKGDCHGIILLEKFKMPTGDHGRLQPVEPPSEFPGDSQPPAGRNPLTPVHEPPAFEPPAAEPPVAQPPRAQPPAGRKPVSPVHAPPAWPVPEPPAAEPPAGRKPVSPVHAPPAGSEPPWQPPTPPVCAAGQVPFEMLSSTNLNICTVACVPMGPCSKEADQGILEYIGITNRGNCIDKGFTLRVNNGMNGFFTTVGGECNTMMQFHKFQKPGAAVSSQAWAGAGTVCQGSQTAYVARPKENPDMCSVYCIPAGDCQGQVQAGHLNHLGIVREGTCHTEGFTDRMQYQMEWTQGVKGPCKGMEVVNYQRPTLTQ